jgi:hypothetical protein
MMIYANLAPLSFSSILGKVPLSVLALHPISLPRAVTDSLQTRNSGGRMTQSGRSETDACLLLPARLLAFHERAIKFCAVTC